MTISEFRQRLSGGRDVPVSRRVSSWQGRRCGDRVTEDGRHFGRVEAVLSGRVKVRWDNGWLSELPLEDVR